MWPLSGGGGCGCGCGGWRGAEGSNVGWLRGGRRGAPQAVSVSVRPRSGKFLAFITLTIVFLIQNYRAFVRGRLAKIRISSPEFLIFGDWRRSAPQAKILRIRTPLGHLGRRARRSAPSASPKKILRFRGQFDHFGAGCGGCGGLGRGCGCEALRARWMWMCGVPRAISAGCVWASRHPSVRLQHRAQIATSRRRSCEV